MYIQLVCRSVRIVLYIYVGPVSVFNNGGELLLDAVINSFILLNSEPVLSLRCFSLKGHGNLKWETRNVSALPDNLTEMTVGSEQDLTVVSYDRDTTLDYANLTPERTGYYSCRSAESGEKFELFTTFGKLCNYMYILMPLVLHNILIDYSKK